MITKKTKRRSNRRNNRRNNINTNKRTNSKRKKRKHNRSVKKSSRKYQKEGGAHQLTAEDYYKFRERNLPGREIQPGTRRKHKYGHRYVRGVTRLPPLRANPVDKSPEPYEPVPELDPVQDFLLEFSKSEGQFEGEDKGQGQTELKKQFQMGVRKVMTIGNVMSALQEEVDASKQELIQINIEKQKLESLNVDYLEQLVGSAMSQITLKVQEEEKAEAEKAEAEAETVRLSSDFESEKTKLLQSLNQKKTAEKEKLKQRIELKVKKDLTEKEKYRDEMEEELRLATEKKSKVNNTLNELWNSAETARLILTDALAAKRARSYGDNHDFNLSMYAQNESEYFQTVDEAIELYIKGLERRKEDAFAKYDEAFLYEERVSSELEEAKRIAGVAESELMQAKKKQEKLVEGEAGTVVAEAEAEALAAVEVAKKAEEETKKEQEKTDFIKKIKQIDLNKDGEISYEEFSRKLKALEVEETDIMILFVKLLHLSDKPELKDKLLLETAKVIRAAAAAEVKEAKAKVATAEAAEVERKAQEAERKAEEAALAAEGAALAAEEAEREAAGTLNEDLVRLKQKAVSALSGYMKQKEEAAAEEAAAELEEAKLAAERAAERAAAEEEAVRTRVESEAEEKKAELREAVAAAEEKKAAAEEKKAAAERAVVAAAEPAVVEAEAIEKYLLKDPGNKKTFKIDFNTFILGIRMYPELFMIINRINFEEEEKCTETKKLLEETKRKLQEIEEKNIKLKQSKLTLEVSERFLKISSNNSNYKTLKNLNPYKSYVKFKEIKGKKNIKKGDTLICVNNIYDTDGLLVYTTGTELKLREEKIDEENNKILHVCFSENFKKNYSYKRIYLLDKFNTYQVRKITDDTDDFEERYLMEYNDYKKIFNNFFNLIPIHYVGVMEELQIPSIITQKQISEQNIDHDKIDYKDVMQMINPILLYLLAKKLDVDRFRIGFDMEEIFKNCKSFHYILFHLLHIFFSDEFWKYLFYALYREGYSELENGFTGNYIYAFGVKKLLSKFKVWEIDDSLTEIVLHPLNIFNRKCYIEFLKRTRGEIFKDPDIQKPFETLFQKKKDELVDFFIEEYTLRGSTSGSTRSIEELRIEFNKNNKEILRNHIKNKTRPVRSQNEKDLVTAEEAHVEEAKRKVANELKKAKLIRLLKEAKLIRLLKEAQERSETLTEYLQNLRQEVDTKLTTATAAVATAETEKAEAEKRERESEGSEGTVQYTFDKHERYDEALEEVKRKTEALEEAIEAEEIQKEKERLVDEFSPEEAETFQEEVKQYTDPEKTEISLEILFNIKYGESKSLQNMSEEERIKNLTRWALMNNGNSKIQRNINRIPVYTSDGKSLGINLSKEILENMKEYYEKEDGNKLDKDDLDYDNLTSNETLFKLLEKCIALTLQKIIDIDNEDFVQKRREMRIETEKINRQRAYEEERLREEKRLSDIREREKREERERIMRLKEFERENREMESNSRKGISFPHFRPASKSCEEECEELDVNIYIADCMESC